MADPELVTTRGLIRRVAAQWLSSYCHRSQGWYDEDKRAIYARLLTLDGETATREDVAAIIGNDSWASLRCHGCGADADAVVRVGEAPDYESSTAQLCGACLSRAAALLGAGDG